MKFTNLTYVKYFLLIAFILLSTNSVLIEISVFNGVFSKNIFRFIALILILSSIILSKVKLEKNILIITFFLIFSAILNLNVDEITLIYLLILIQATQIISNDLLVSKLFFVSAITFSLIFVLLYYGITINEVREFRERTTYGMNGVGGPTLFYNILYGFIILGSMYFHGKKEKLFLFFSLFLSVYFYTTTDVRGGAASYIIFVLLLFTLRFILRLKFIHIFIRFIPFWFLLITLLVTFTLNNEYFNHILSFRPSLYADFFERIKFIDFILGTSVKKYDLFSIVDNSYIHLLVGGNIIFFIYFSYNFDLSTRILIKEKDYKKLAYIIAVSLYLIVESLAVRVENMFIIYYWYLILLRGGYGIEKVYPMSQKIIFKT